MMVVVKKAQLVCCIISLVILNQCKTVDSSDTLMTSGGRDDGSSQKGTVGMLHKLVR